MAKTAISLTIDQEVLSGIKESAKIANRSLSNFTEVIFKEYLQANGTIRHSYESAKAIGKNREIITFEELNADLDNNVFISASDEKFLKNLQNK